jgi:radical SAM-linked protein
MQQNRYRLRITFAKQGVLKYSSHLDLMRVWARSLRRAAVPLVYSQGFNPRPKLQLAAALPLGHSAGHELLDVWLEAPVDPADLAAALAPVLPEGLHVRDVRPVKTYLPAAQTLVVAAEYRVTVEWDEPAPAVQARVDAALAAESLPHRRRGKRYDLRPLIDAIRLERCDAGQVVLGMRLSCGQHGTGRPEAVLDVMGMRDAFAQYHRERLILR